MSWRDILAEKAQKGYKRLKTAAKETVNAAQNGRWDDVVDNISALSKDSYNETKALLKQDGAKEAVKSACLLGASTTVGGAGIASGGTAVAGTVILGIGIPIYAPALITAGLIGGGSYYAIKAYKKLYKPHDNAANVPPAEPVGDWAQGQDTFMCGTFIE